MLSDWMITKLAKENANVKGLELEFEGASFFIWAWWYMNNLKVLTIIFKLNVFNMQTGMSTNLIQYIFLESPWLVSICKSMIQSFL